jgi:hypothetical protein
MAASFTTTPTMITYGDNYAYQIDITTSDSTGEFKVQGSVNYQAQQGVQEPEDGAWVDLPLGGPTTNPEAAGANDNIIINLNQLPFNAIRLVYTPDTAGTGTCDVWVMGKML